MVIRSPTPTPRSRAASSAITIPLSPGPGRARADRRLPDRFMEISSRQAVERFLAGLEPHRELEPPSTARRQGRARPRAPRPALAVEAVERDGDPGGGGARDLRFAAVDGADEGVDQSEEGDEDGHDRRRSRARSAACGAGRAGCCGAAAARAWSPAGAGACQRRRAPLERAERKPTRIASIGGMPHAAPDRDRGGDDGSTRPSSAPLTKTSGSKGVRITGSGSRSSRTPRKISPSAARARARGPSRRRRSERPAAAAGSPAGAAARRAPFRCRSRGVAPRRSGSPG